MAYKFSKNPAERLAGVIHSEAIYNRLAYLAYETGQINLTDKQHNQIDEYRKFDWHKLLNGKTGYSPLAISNSAKDTVKIKIRFVGLPNSPAKESNDTSRKLMESLQTTAIMRYVAKKKYNIDHSFYTSMLTINFVNADFGHLSDAIQLQLWLYQRLRKHFRDTVSKKLKARDNNIFLGLYPDLELTIQPDRLKSRNGHQLYNVHMHVLVFTTERPSRYLYDLLWNKYSKDCAIAGVKASKKAFMMEDAYTKPVKAKKPNIPNDDDDDDANNAQTNSALAEATKYVVKPEELNSLAVSSSVRVDKNGKLRDTKRGNGEPSADDKFKLSVFAEIYRAFTEPSITKDCPYNVADELRQRLGKRVRIQPSGLYGDAHALRNSLVKAGFGGLLTFQKSHGDLGLVPNFFTKLLQVQIKGFKRHEPKVFKRGTYVATRGSGYQYFADMTTSNLSNEEILYYNRNYIANACFGTIKRFNDKLAKTGWLKADGSPADGLKSKQLAVLDLIQHYCQLNSNIDDLKAVIDDWISTVNSAYEDGEEDERCANRLDDLSALKNALNATPGGPFYELQHVRHFKNYDDAARLYHVARQFCVVESVTRVNYYSLNDDERDKWLESLKPAIDAFVVMHTGTHLFDYRANDKLRAKIAKYPSMKESRGNWVDYWLHPDKTNDRLAKRNHDLDFIINSLKLFMSDDDATRQLATNYGTSDYGGLTYLTDNRVLTSVLEWSPVESQNGDVFRLTVDGDHLENMMAGLLKSTNVNNHAYDYILDD